MNYPPKPHRMTDKAAVNSIVRTYPFAHLFTGHLTTQRVTRLPFAYDAETGPNGMLRGHINRANPQAHQIEGVDCLVAFSGPDAYISPNWRSDKTRAATWDYTAVHMWGRIRVRPELTFFAQLVNDLAAPQERDQAAITNLEPWHFECAPDEYVSRLFPHLVAFEIQVDRIEAISKLHQDFPIEDQESVAKQLRKIRGDNHQMLASEMLKSAAVRRSK